MGGILKVGIWLGSPLADKGLWLCVWRWQILKGILCLKKKSMVVPGGEQFVVPDCTTYVLIIFPMLNSLGRDVFQPGPVL